MKKIFAMIVLSSLMTLYALPVHAATFDARYYSLRYPEVTNMIGTGEDALYQHYMTFGINEGRFASAEDELAHINQMLIGQNTESATVSVQPVQTETAVISTPQVVPGLTYVDVDTSTQIMTYYENGIVKLQSPCVTGGVGHETPKGTWKIMSHIPGKTLRGKTWKCWVDRWMQFTPDACGLHDANWRDQFGGNIYQVDGSHGCVNLPHDTAVLLFDMVNVGTTVVVR